MAFSNGNRSRWIVAIAMALGVASAGVTVDLARPPSPAPPSWGQTDAVWIAVYNGFEVNFTITQLGGLLHPGDGITVVMFNNSENWSLDNYYAGLLHAAFPGVILRAHMNLDGGTGRAGGLSSTIHELSPLFTQASADWEINGPVEFNASFNSTLAYFDSFASIVRNSGRAAIGYPSGRGVLGDYSLPAYHWDYGVLAKHLDGMTIETQSLCLNASEWPPGMSKIWSEYNASGESIRTLSLQISLGSAWNGVNATEASYCAKYWRTLSHGNLFLWWGGEQNQDLVTVLRAIGR